jgi:hypothetical protein
VKSRGILKYSFLVISLILYITSQMQKPEYSPDDTFIYMQYAKNIASGNGFSFNAGEPSYGVTSPLWVLMISTAYLLKLDGFWFAKILDLVFAIGSVIVFFRLTRFFYTEESILRYAAVAVFIINPWFVRWSFTGMETSLAVLLMLYVFYLFYSEKYTFMFSMLGIFYLVRPESSVLSLLMFAVILIYSFKRKVFRAADFVKYVSLFLIAILPFVIYSYYNFGTVLPNTVLGKSTQTINAQVIINQLREIFKTLAASSLPEIILSVLFIISALRKKNFQNTAPMLLWAAALIILYTVTDADIISRYFLIITPVFIITGVKFTEYIYETKQYAVVVLIVVCLLYSQFVFYKFVKPSTDDFTKGVNECFIPTGKWLNENTAPGSKILVNDVGAIGYYSGRYIIDAAALVNADLELNRKIMKTPVEERITTHNLLKFIQCDYVIDRDTNETIAELSTGMEFMTMRKFPSLGVRDSSPRYYKVYKVIK